MFEKYICQTLNLQLSEEALFEESYANKVWEPLLGLQLQLQYA